MSQKKVDQKTDERRESNNVNTHQLLVQKPPDLDHVTVIKNRGKVSHASVTQKKGSVHSQASVTQKKGSVHSHASVTQKKGSVHSRASVTQKKGSKERHIPMSQKKGNRKKKKKRFETQKKKNTFKISMGDSSDSLDDGIEVSQKMESYRISISINVLNYTDFHQIDFENDRLGGGGFGDVFKITRKSDDNKFAVKIVPIRQSSRVKDEKNIEKEINIHHFVSRHPNVVNIYGYFTRVSNSNNFANIKEYWIIMELMDTSLYDIFDDNSLFLHPFQQIPILLKILNGLSFIHSKGIVHRDLKLGNILIGYGHRRKQESHEVRICDFGLSNKSDEISILSNMKGTRVFLPPRNLEYAGVVRNETTVEEYRKKFPLEFNHFKQDIYSFGILMWEMIHKKSFPKTITEQYKDERKQSTVSNGVFAKELVTKGFRPNIMTSSEKKYILNRIITKCWNQNEDERYDDVNDIIRDLKEWKRELLWREFNKNVGIKNEGNYCFFSSVLQILFRISYISQVILLSKNLRNENFFRIFRAINNQFLIASDSPIGSDCIRITSLTKSALDFFKNTMELGLSFKKKKNKQKKKTFHPRQTGSKLPVIFGTNDSSEFLSVFFNKLIEINEMELDVERKPLIKNSIHNLFFNEIAVTITTFFNRTVQHDIHPMLILRGNIGAIPLKTEYFRLNDGRIIGKNVRYTTIQQLIEYTFGRHINRKDEIEYNNNIKFLEIRQENVCVTKLGMYVFFTIGDLLISPFTREFSHLFVNSFEGKLKFKVKSGIEYIEYNLSLKGIVCHSRPAHYITIIPNYQKNKFTICNDDKCSSVESEGIKNYLILNGHFPYIFCFLNEKETTVRYKQTINHQTIFERRDVIQKHIEKLIREGNYETRNENTLQIGTWYAPSDYPEDESTTPGLINQGFYYYEQMKQNNIHLIQPRPNIQRLHPRQSSDHRDRIMHNLKHPPIPPPPPPKPPHPLNKNRVSQKKNPVQPSNIAKTDRTVNTIPAPPPPLKQNNLTKKPTIQSSEISKNTTTKIDQTKKVQNSNRKKMEGNFKRPRPRRRMVMEIVPLNDDILNGMMNKYKNDYPINNNQSESTERDFTVEDVFDFTTKRRVVIEKSFMNLTERELVPIQRCDVITEIPDATKISLTKKNTKLFRENLCSPWEQSKKKTLREVLWKDGMREIINWDGKMRRCGGVFVCANCYFVMQKRQKRCPQCKKMKAAKLPCQTKYWEIWKRDNKAHQRHSITINHSHPRANVKMNPSDSIEFVAMKKYISGITAPLKGRDIRLNKVPTKFEERDSKDPSKIRIRDVNITDIANKTTNERNARKFAQKVNRLAKTINNNRDTVNHIDLDNIGKFINVTLFNKMKEKDLPRNRLRNPNFSESKPDTYYNFPYYHRGWGDEPYFLFLCASPYMLNVSNISIVVGVDSTHNELKFPSKDNPKRRLFHWTIVGINPLTGKWMVLARIRFTNETTDMICRSLRYFGHILERYTGKTLLQWFNDLDGIMMDFCLVQIFGIIQALKEEGCETPIKLFLQKAKACRNRHYKENARKLGELLFGRGTSDHKSFMKLVTRDLINITPGNDTQYNKKMNELNQFNAAVDGQLTLFTQYYFYRPIVRCMLTKFWTLNPHFSELPENTNFVETKQREAKENLGITTDPFEQISHTQDIDSLEFRDYKNIVNHSTTQNYDFLAKLARAPRRNKNKEPHKRLLRLEVKDYQRKVPEKKETMNKTINLEELDLDEFEYLGNKERRHQEENDENNYIDDLTKIFLAVLPNGKDVDNRSLDEVRKEFENYSQPDRFTKKTNFPRMNKQINYQISDFVRNGTKKNGGEEKPKFRSNLHPISKDLGKIIRNASKKKKKNLKLADFDKDVENIIKKTPTGRGKRKVREKGFYRKLNDESSSSNSTKTNTTSKNPDLYIPPSQDQVSSKESSNTNTNTIKMNVPPPPIPPEEISCIWSRITQTSKQQTKKRDFAQNKDTPKKKRRKIDPTTLNKKNKKNTPPSNPPIEGFDIINDRFIENEDSYHTNPDFVVYDQVENTQKNFKALKDGEMSGFSIKIYEDSKKPTLLNIPRKDIKTLINEEWVSDIPINTYIRLLQEHLRKNGKKNIFIATSQLYLKLVEEGPEVANRFLKKHIIDSNGDHNVEEFNIFSLDKLIIPIHLGCHWILCVVDFNTNNIHFYDSLKYITNNIAENIKRLLLFFSSKDDPKINNWVVVQHNQIQQRNEIDCGVFMLMFMRCIVLAENNVPNFWFSQNNIPVCRDELTREIFNAKIQKNWER